jgi:stage III sporulation protein SpoIIIAA
MTLEITDNISALVDVMPPDIADALRANGRFDALLEVVLDKGRVCEARYVDGNVTLSPREMGQEDLDYVVQRIGAFGDDNRAGIERTLHRISAIRNRTDDVIGLTCRVGRAVFGTIDIMRDIVESGQSILLLGRPGVGKTTMLREVARVLADSKRVVIVDTSNEIGGDGDIPHPAIGRARRMQVKKPSRQHKVMIEAVENHMPQVIIIDEIGNEYEAAAARTIAERGVQLVGTAHGNTLDNLMMNPTLSDLVGGIQTVTLSDEEARRRGTQKSVLERKSPPTFDVVVEIQDFDRVAVRHDVAAAVDAALRGRSLEAEIRTRLPSGEIEKTEVVVAEPTNTHAERVLAPRTLAPAESPVPAVREWLREGGRPQPLRVYPYGLNQNRIRQASKSLNLPIILVNDVAEADVLFTLRTYYRQRPQAIADAERRGLPVYVLRNNTAEQMEHYLAEIFGLRLQADPQEEAVAEARQAILSVKSGRSRSVQLSPQAPSLRKMQHEMVREADLLSRSSGTEPRRRVTVYSNQ